MKYLKILSRTGHFNLVNPDEESTSVNIQLVDTESADTARPYANVRSNHEINEWDFNETTIVDEVLSLLETEEKRYWINTGRQNLIDFKALVEQNREELTVGYRQHRIEYLKDKAKKLQDQLSSINKELDSLTNSVQYRENVMREIKFRAWDKDKGEMIYWEDLKNTYGLFLNTPNDWLYVSMQYTGLKDKNGKEIYEGDILHVVEDSTWGGEYLIPVEWVDYNTAEDKWAFYGCECAKAKEISHRENLTNLFTRGFLTRSFGSCIHLAEMTRGGFQIEVIGNIYENPELLKA